MPADASGVVVFGIPDSVYVRIVRLTLLEKGAPHQLEEVDPFAPGGAPAEHLARHPFGRIPAFRHGDFALYETSAIARYVDEVFPGPRLQPNSPQLRARMNQAIAMLDAYAYRTFVWDLYVERCVRPAADEARVARALPHAERCLRALAEVAPSAAWLAGPELTLADLHAAPMIDYLTATPDANALLEPHGRLRRWWEALCARESLRALGIGARARSA